MGGLSDLGNAERFRFDPRFLIHLSDHGRWMWFDGDLKIWRFKLPKSPVLFFGLLIEQPPRKIAHLGGYRHEVFKPKAYFKRAAGGAVHAFQHDIVGAFDFAVAKIQFAIGPDFYRHVYSLSDGDQSPSSVTQAGGASSPVRGGGAA